MDARAVAPAIVAHGWGRIELEDGRTFKDAKLWPGGAREWDWNETGTGHRQGIQPADVDELVENGAEVVILSRGRLRQLGVAPATLERLASGGVEVEVLPTGEAIERYGEMRTRRPVGALIHSTC